MQENEPVSEKSGLNGGIASEISESESTATPAICLIIDPASQADLADTVLKAHTRGYDVYVGVRETDTESIQQAQQLGVTGMLRFREAVPDENIRLDLMDAVQRNGHSGAVFHDPTTTLDIDASVEKFEESDQVVIDSVTESLQSQHIIVGIPAYNEEIGIGSTIHRAARYSDEVVVIDDGSQDRTPEIARDAGATVLEHDTNRGKGAAIRTFFEYVSDESFGSIVLMDGDGQHVPGNLPDVAGPILSNDADIVIGSRYLNGQETETPFYRRFGQRVLDILTTGSSRTKVTDSQSGFRALSPTAVEKLRISTDGMGVESEMINDATAKDLTIKEAPIDVRYEGIDGQTYNPLRHGLSVATFILQLVRDRHPMLFFGGPGLILTVFGSLYGLDGILVYQQTGTFYPAKVLVAGFTTIIGVLGIFCGLILNRISNMISDI